MSTLVARDSVVKIVKAMSEDSVLREQYAQAVQVQHFESFRAQRLAAHALSRNEALAKRAKPPLEPVVVKIAAVLMAAQEQLSSPTALAEAETLAETPGLGQALLHIQAGLDYLANDSDWTALAHDGLLRAATEHVVRQLAHESAGLLEALSSGALTNTSE